MKERRSCQNQKGFWLINRPQAFRGICWPSKPPRSTVSLAMADGRRRTLHHYSQIGASIPAVTVSLCGCASIRGSIDVVTCFSSSFRFLLQVRHVRRLWRLCITQNRIHNRRETKMVTLCFFTFNFLQKHSDNPHC